MTPAFQYGSVYYVVYIYIVYVTWHMSHTAGLWSLVAPNRSPGEVHSPLADHSLLLMLVLTHQQTKAHNPYRTALYTFSDERGGKGAPSFSVSLEKLYLTLCQWVDSDTVKSRLILCIYFGLGCTAKPLYKGQVLLHHMLASLYL